MVRTFLACLSLTVALFVHSHQSGEEMPTGSGAGGIQWFATWESALAEAKRTGRPIFLVSAAPHCAGVSGIW